MQVGLTTVLQNPLATSASYIVVMATVYACHILVSTIVLSSTVTVCLGACKGVCLSLGVVWQYLLG